ncbi:alcohol dehydrogenase-like [Musca autumnalis]|uniref:alcohol dehydrogenase-like n=1 Tax=Musca autumnalis TaxID=221902 RepID=UPI003CFB840F
MELKGKNIVFVGGFGGMGVKSVEAFLKKSVKSLLILDLQQNDEFLKYLQTTYKNSLVDYIPIDLTRSEDITEAFRKAKERVNTFDVVVNGAGILNELNIERIVQINLSGVIQSSLIAMEYMSKANGGQGGCIVNISSTCSLNPTDFMCVYGPTKSALNYFTNLMAKPLYFEKTGVSFITICPGLIMTPMAKDIGNLIAAKHIPNIERIFYTAVQQTATVYAENLIKVLEIARNGSTWVLDDGKIEEIHIPNVWGPALNYNSNKS